MLKNSLHTIASVTAYHVRDWFQERTPLINNIKPEGLTALSTELCPVNLCMR